MYGVTTYTTKCLILCLLGHRKHAMQFKFTTFLFTNQNRLSELKQCCCLGDFSLWDDSVPPPPGSLHLPLPADVIPGRGHVLHGPPAPAAHVRGAGGLAGGLPLAHEATGVGLLDVADHAMTETRHRGRRGARLTCCVSRSRCQQESLTAHGASMGRNVGRHISDARGDPNCARGFCQWYAAKRNVTRGFHACMCT